VRKDGFPDAKIALEAEHRFVGELLGRRVGW